VTFVLRGPGEEDDSRQQYAIKLEFVGADPDVQPVGEDRTEAIISYFKGSPEEWKTGLPTYAGVAYPDLWPGIDLVYSGDASLLKYTFLVKPGADPGQIRLAYDGASAVTLNGAGQLEVSTPAGGFQDDRPVAYQDAGGQRVPVESSYALDEEAHSYGFQVGSYDPDMPLVIDPAVLDYCGYIGGSDFDDSLDIAVDGSGCAYVTGSTSSGNNSFPVTVGPKLSYNGSDDAFVAKVRADGTDLVYCGYIGGNESDRGRGIAVDGSGSAYVTGSTSSGNTTFPVAVGPKLIHNGSDDAFVAKVKANPNDVVPVNNFDYCGYIGGNESDMGRGIAVDGSGYAYVTGYTKSFESTFPVTIGPDLAYNGGNWDAFVAKVRANPNNSIPVDNFDYCGYIGGNESDMGNGIAVDSSGSAYVVGTTDSDQTTFPATVGPDLTYNGGEDAFVTRVKPNPNDAIPVNNFDYCGYIGGSDQDRGYGIAVDGPDNAYVTGATRSDEATFPVTVGPDLTYQSSDAFVARVKPNPNDAIPVNNFDYCGYIGGYEGEDEGTGIAVDEWGCAYVSGYTMNHEDPPDRFPVTVGPDLTYNGGGTDAFVAKVCYTMPVGGVVEPVDRLQILAPWLGLAAFIVLAMSVIVITQRKRAT
jgi:hypothetical protein